MRSQSQCRILGFVGLCDSCHGATAAGVGLNFSFQQTTALTSSPLSAASLNLISRQSPRVNKLWNAELKAVTRLACFLERFDVYRAIAAAFSAACWVRIALFASRRASPEIPPIRGTRSKPTAVCAEFTQSPRQLEQPQFKVWSGFVIEFGFALVHGNEYDVGLTFYRGNK